MSFNRNSGYLFLAPATSESTAYETDTTLRNMVNTAYEGVTISDVPDDEEVLAYLRESGAEITVEGETVPAEQLTTDYFKVRWTSLKYESGDGWHVDGILVAKATDMNITKTFSGDDEGINQIKSDENGYAIIVSHEDEDSNTVQDYELTLKPADEETEEGKVGYTSYDEKTDTYTWTISGHPRREYTVKEVNYQLTGDWENINKYKVDDGTEDSSWADYTSDGVKIKMHSYGADTPSSDYETLAFSNTYTKAGTLVIFKTDSFSGDGLSDVEFHIKKSGSDSELELFHKPGTSLYSTDARAREDGYTDVVTDGLIKTGSSGAIFVDLPSGTYELTETAPSGYEAQDKITVTINSDAQITKLDESELYSGLNTNTLTVRNESKQLIKITATMDWGEEDDEDKVPVEVELYCNGKKLQGSKYTQILNSSNDWTYDWSDLPLFIDGELANYTLRETKIGSIAYDASADTDGYADYTVTYDATKYREGDEGNYTEDATWTDDKGKVHYANEALLCAHTRSDAGTTSIDVSKIWDDEQDNDGIRPDGVIIKLYKDGQFTGKQLSLSKDNDFKGKISNLQKYSDGQKIQYTISEEEVSGYTTKIDGSTTDGFEVTNTHDSEKISVKGTVNWVDDDSDVRPETIDVNLLKNGEVIDKVTATPDADGNWNFEISDLYKYDDGKEAVYTVELATELSKGYTTEINGDSASGFVITNTYSKIDIKGSVKWENDTEDIRPDSVVVKLLKNGEAVEEVTVSPDADGNWNFEFTGKYKYDGDEEIVYTVELATELDENYKTEITGDATNGFEITNAYSKEEPPTPTPDPPTPSPDPEPIGPTTGDPSQTTLLTSMLVISGSLIVVLAGVLLKRKNKET